MLPPFIDREKVPHKPGIYIYKNAQGEILYVGKAIDLYHRVSSYFSGSNQSVKTASLVKEIRGIETIVVESELEALILEANLIKKHLPPFNIRLTDDKDYIYIKITKEVFPRVITARKQDLRDAKKYFGPFPSSTVVKNTLKSLRRIFPWCANPPKVKGKGKREEGKKKQLGVPSDLNLRTRRLKRPCFYYHLRLCPGPCVGVIGQKDYQKIVNRLGLLLDGKKVSLVEELNREMMEYSNKQDFESALRVKRTLQGLQYLTQPNRIKNYLDNPNFLEDQNRVALAELQKVLGLKDLPERIECYDISNIQGANATGSMVVLTNGEIDKSQYRRFKIKIGGKPNDVGMHKEMMKRRLKHDEWPLPQVFIIDGGRGQVRGSWEELLAKGVNIPIFGLAKRMEWLYPPQGELIKIPKSRLALRLLQKIRDEAHRFAITYHRKLRAKSFLV